MKRVLLAAVRGYQLLLSPLSGVACRYEPSCSHYMYEAIEAHGSARGTWLGLRRLGRCRPGGGSGYDPVPPRNDQRDDAGDPDAPGGDGAVAPAVAAARADRDERHTR